MKIIPTTLIAVLISGSLSAAQENTLPATIRRHGGPVGGTVNRYISPDLDFKQLAKDSDLIARVVIVDRRSHLTKDQISLETDHTVQILDQYSSRRTIKPGETIVVTKPGGTATVEGYAITVLEQDFPPFEVGDEYILFLRFDAVTGHYDVVGGAQGAFKNVGAAVKQVSKGGAWRDMDQMPILPFVQELADTLEKEGLKK